MNVTMQISPCQRQVSNRPFIHSYTTHNNPIRTHREPLSSQYQLVPYSTQHKHSHSHSTPTQARKTHMTTFTTIRGTGPNPSSVRPPPTPTPTKPLTPHQRPRRPNQIHQLQLDTRRITPTPTPTPVIPAVDSRVRSVAKSRIPHGGTRRPSDCCEVSA